MRLAVAFLFNLQYDCRCRHEILMHSFVLISKKAIPDPTNNGFVRTQGCGGVSPAGALSMLSPASC